MLLKNIFGRGAVDIDIVIADIVNELLQDVVAVVNLLTSWMPDSPFQKPISEMRNNIGSDILGYINYFLPVSEFLAVVSVWVPAVFIYYASSTVLRWAKSIS